jgi:dihydroorotase
MLIRNGRLVDPAQRLDSRLDVRLSNGVVAEIAEHLDAAPGEEAFDAAGAFVAPGFIDMHVHLREPGNPEKETIATGTSAAAAGGFTAVAAMPNTNPAIDTPQAVRWVKERAEEFGLVRVYPIAAITRGRIGEQQVDYAALLREGAVAFSDDGSTIMNARVEIDAARAAGSDAPFITHCEDANVKGDAYMTSSAEDRLAEDLIVARDLLIARALQRRWHIAHLSTATGVDLVRWVRASKSAAAVTCEVTPHHLVFTRDFVESHGASGKVNPPLRFDEDVRALRDAVRDGTIDAFATDHAPHTEEEKRAALHEACVGFTGLEIAVGAYAYALPDLAVTRFVELFSTNPARILRIPGGTLKKGSPADVTIFADRPWTVDPAQFYSKGKSTPFAGMTLPRRAIGTIVGGTLVMRDGRVLSQVKST